MCIRDRIEATPRAVPEPPRPEAMKITRAAFLYTQLNMHPRALALLNEHRQLLGPVAGILAQDYAQEWREVLHEYCRDGDANTLFGQTVPSDNPLTLSIPPPCSAHGIARAKAILGGSLKPIP